MNNPLSLPCAIGAWEGEGEWVDDLGTQGLHPALYYAAPTGLRRAKMPPIRGLCRAKMPPMRGAMPCQDAAHEGEGGKDVSYLHLFIVSVSYYCCSAKLLIPCEIRNRSALFSAFLPHHWNKIAPWAII